MACAAVFSLTLASGSASAASSNGFSGGLNFSFGGLDSPTISAASGQSTFYVDGSPAGLELTPTTLSRTFFNSFGTVSGSVGLKPTSNLTPDGGWAPDATLTVSGTYSVSGAFVYDGGFNPTGPNTIWSGSGTFSKTIAVSSILQSFSASNSNFPLLSFAGPGQSAGSGSATINITGISIAQNKSLAMAVPESATLNMMALGLTGLAGLAAARRRARRH
jgi:hypothetical protein